MATLRKVRSVALVAKKGNAAGETVRDKAGRWLQAKGIAVSLGSHPEPVAARDRYRDVDLVLVFAGDGTMVSIARHCLEPGIPVGGVNFGRVGFLAELSEDTWEQALEDVLANGLRVEERMSLRFELFRAGALLQAGEVVNDVVVTRGKVARLVSLHLFVNSSPFLTLRSDGLILSTPTGASGYACSAGGPLMLPALNAYVVAAICPYLGSFPPLVLEPEVVFTVKVDEVAADLYLTLDGQETHALDEGDTLHVRGLPGRVLMANFGQKSYFARLLRAGFVQGAHCRT